MLSEPRTENLSPLGQLSVFSDRPVTAHLWLSAADKSVPHGVKLQCLPKLVPGLRRLTHVEEFLMQDEPERHKLELAMKQRGFDHRASETLVSEPESIAAQSEALEVLLDFLPKRYPHLYTVERAEDGQAVAVIVSSTSERHAVEEYKSRPLELCGRLVQV